MVVFLESWLGTFCGDWWVAPCMAQQLSDVVKAAIAPISTCAVHTERARCVAHALQSFVQENPSMMVMSIDGIGI